MATRRLAATATLLLLAGCGGGGTVLYEPMRTAAVGVPAEFAYAVRSGAMPTQILGNPFGVPQARLDAAVLAAMKDASRSPPVTFVADAGARPDGLYKVVVVFGAAPPGVNDAVCLDPPQAWPAAAAGPVSVAAAFCRGPQLMSQATGVAAGPVAVDDAAFRRLIRDVTYAMIPPPQRRERGGLAAFF